MGQSPAVGAGGRCTTDATVWRGPQASQSETSVTRGRRLDRAAQTCAGILKLRRRELRGCLRCGCSPYRTEVQPPWSKTPTPPSTYQTGSEQFLTAGALSADAVAPGVLNSWRRSRDLQVHPDRVDLPYVREPDTDTPLDASPPHRCCAGSPRISSAQAVSVVLTSADGLVLDRIAADPKIERVLDDCPTGQGLQLCRGVRRHERHRHQPWRPGRPTFIQGSEHYVGTLGRLSCAGSPIRESDHPTDGRRRST